MAINAHNAKFEVKISRINGIFFPEEQVEDTMLLADEFSTEFPKGLKRLVTKIFDYHYEDETMGKQQMNELSGEQVYKYACDDARLTRELYLYFLQQLDSEVLEHYQYVELPIIPVLASMELRGINFDREFCLKEEKICKDKIKELGDKINAAVGFKLNPRSPKQLQKYFIQTKSYDIWKTTATGAPSMDADSLKHYFTVDKDEVAGMILEYKGYAQLASLFFSKLPLLQHEDTKRIHAEFRQANTQTSRFSSSSPNLQQSKKGDFFPEGAEEAVNVRKVFIADNMYEKIVSLDFSGIELRVCAVLTEDETMVHALQNDLDLHTETAKGVFGADIVNDEEFKSKYRRVAKTMNFLILYGGKEFRLAGTLNQEFTEEECKDFIAKWYETYPGVLTAQRQSAKDVLKNRYAETLWGRRRYFENYNPNISTELEKMERAAFNHQIQGTAADIMKMVMIRIYREMPDLKMLMTVHDELVFSIPVKGLVKTVKKIHKIFTDWDFIVPIYSSVDVGDSYGTMTSFEKPNGDADFEALKEVYGE